MDAHDFFIRLISEKYRYLKLSHDATPYYCKSPETAPKYEYIWPAWREKTLSCTFRENIGIGSMESELVNILIPFTEEEDPVIEEDPVMEEFDGKVYETFSKSECLDILTNFGINGLMLCSNQNIAPIPDLL